MFEEIKYKLAEGYYDNKLPCPTKDKTMKDGYITDENKSVKWNIEQVQNNLNNYKNKLKAYREENVKLTKEFEKDVINNMMKTYNFTSQASKFLLGEAYEENSSYGILNILTKLEDLIETVNEFNNLNK